MKRVWEFLKTITQEKYLPLWGFAVIQLIYHIFMREPESSDAMWFFRNQLDAYSLKDYLVIRYHSWSSRFLIEGVLVYISRHMLLWKIVDYVFWVFLAWAFAWLFPEEKRRVACFMTVGFLLMYPIWDLRTAGWIATSVNYTWALALGVFSLHGVTRVLYGKKTPVWLALLYILAGCYGANMEQMCAVLLAVNFLAILYFAYNKTDWKKYWHVFAGFVVSLGEILFILTCPGNALRENQEIANWMPKYASFDFVDKICLGFVETMQHLLNSGNFMFLLFAVILAVLVFLKSEELLHRFFAVIPVVMNVVLTFFQGMLEKYVPSFWELFENNAYVSGSNYHLGESYTLMFLYLLVLGSVLVSLVVVCESWAELIAQCYLLVLGLATRVIMGFTPTIYVSKERTYLFFYMILGVSATWLIVNNIAVLRAKKRLLETMQLLGGCFVLFSVIFGLVQTGRLGMF
ncbi:MAG: hypothetical protein NC307_05745 [Roseburia sp.]|nr:hypothetical protein [Roseburia sp.]